MRRKAFIGALLLPLPFAALPVVAMFFGGSGSQSHTLIVQSPASDSMTVSTLLPAVDTDSLAYGVTAPYDGRCDSGGHTES
jgi:hypothetical protein